MTHDTVKAALLEALNGAFDGRDGEDWFEGLNPTLDSISAETASRRPAPGRSSIAAHTRHVLYTLETVNAWLDGERPALDWTAAWQRPTVTEADWTALKTALGAQRRTLEEKLRASPEFTQDALELAMKNLAHLGYHTGAIRQLRLEA
jgi:DinB superfamily